MHIITKKEILDTLKEVVNEQGGDYVYQAALSGECTYVKTSESDACGVGRALSKLGVPEDVLKSMDNLLDTEGDSGIGSGPILDLLRAAGYSFEADAHDVAKIFQYEQDSKIPWGVCLDLASRAEKE